MSNLWSNGLSSHARRTDLWPRPDTSVEGDDAFALGFAEGRRAVEAEFAAERGAVIQLFEAVEALQPGSAAPIATMIVTAVERLVLQIVGDAPIDAALLQARAHAAAAVIADHAGGVLRVHPDDMVLLHGSRIGIPVQADAELARGSIRIDAGDRRVEDGVANALERLRDALDAAGLMR